MFKKKKRNDEYYRLDRIHSAAPDADIYVIAGEKGNGKSYAVKEAACNCFRDTGGRFVYLRRFDEDVTASKVERGFSDLIDLDKMTGGYDYISPLAGTLQAYKLKETGGEIKKKEGTPCGYYGSLKNIQKRFSSVPFLNVNLIIFDEFCPKDGIYLPDEIELFDIVLSTIIRRNEQVKIYLCGNTFDRNCPYFKKYRIDVMNAEQGNIYVHDLYNTDGSSVKVAFEYCENLVSNQNRLLVSGRENIVKGQWYEKTFDKIENLKEYRNAYTFYIESVDKKYKCEYLVKGMDSAIYVCEYDELQYPLNSRVISKKITTSALHTPKLYPLTPEEGQIFTLLKMGKIFYSDNLTGTEFERIIKAFI